MFNVECLCWLIVEQGKYFQFLNSNSTNQHHHLTQLFQTLSPATLSIPLYISFLIVVVYTGNNDEEEKKSEQKFFSLPNQLLPVARMPPTS